MSLDGIALRNKIMTVFPEMTEEEIERYADTIDIVEALGYETDSFFENHSEIKEGKHVKDEEIDLTEANKAARELGFTGFRQLTKEELDRMLNDHYYDGWWEDMEAEFEAGLKEEEEEIEKRLYEENKNKTYFDNFDSIIEEVFSEDYRKEQ